MSYQKINMDGLPSGSTAVMLDSGETVIVRCDIELANGGYAYTASAKCLDPKVSTGAVYVSPNAEVADRGSEWVARQCLMAVLGEPVDKPWTDKFLAPSSIRVAISAAKAAVVIDAGELL